MRGEERQQRSMLMVLNLEQRVPQDHPLRRIKQLAETVLQGLSFQLPTNIHAVSSSVVSSL
jgi:hypothetical protein